MTKNELAQYIDHTLLRVDATENDIIDLCSEAAENNLYSVCVNPTWVALCSDQLAESSVKVCSTVGFPLGATTTEAKVAETKSAIEEGADEIDMVMNIGLLLSDDPDEVQRDIEAVVQAAGSVPVKVILEMHVLPNEDIKRRACELAVAAGAAFLKTSTGFSGGGATVEDVQLMREMSGPTTRVKASGGVKTAEDALKMIEAGATRIGASKSLEILAGLE